MPFPPSRHAFTWASCWKGAPRSPKFVLQTGHLERQNRIKPEKRHCHAVPHLLGEVTQLRAGLLSRRTRCQQSRLVNHNALHGGCTGGMQTSGYDCCRLFITRLAYPLESGCMRDVCVYWVTYHLRWVEERSPGRTPITEDSTTSSTMLRAMSPTHIHADENQYSHAAWVVYQQLLSIS